MMTQQDCSIPDESLRAAILAAFAADSCIASDDLRVGVLNRIAHLAGVVDTLAKRTTAEELAGQIPGIRGVVNRIDAPGAPSPARVVNLTTREGEWDET